MQKASKDIQLFIFIFYEYNSSGISNINALGLYDSMRTVTQLCFLINVSCLFNATVHASVGKWSPLKPKTRRLWAKTPASPSCQRVWESHPSPAGSLAPCSMQYVCVCLVLASLVQSPSQICLWPCINPAWRQTRHTHTHAVMPEAGCDSRGGCRKDSFLCECSSTGDGSCGMMCFPVCLDPQNMRHEDTCHLQQTLSLHAHRGLLGRDFYTPYDK